MGGSARPHGNRSDQKVRLISSPVTAPPTPSNQEVVILSNASQPEPSHQRRGERARPAPKPIQKAACSPGRGRKRGRD